MHSPLSQHLALPPGALTVHKFGGTSMARLVEVAAIVRRAIFGNLERPVVVVSAIAGVTNALYAALEDGAVHLERVRDMHLAVLTQLQLDVSATGICLSAGSSDRLRTLISADLHHIHHLLTAPPVSACLIAGYGEIWSSQILAALLSDIGVPAGWANARNFIHLSELSDKDARVDWARSCAPPVPESTVLILTGFLASDHEGNPSTLRRNGSDHSGGIFANLLDAASLTIWTDVDGIFSADPRVVSSAARIESMNFKETSELAYFGAKVIHPQTMAPCVKKNIPIILRNTFNTDCPGTLIQQQGSAPARAVTSIPKVALINVEGAGLFGFSGIAAKLFSAVADAQCNVIMITQASSEYSICFAVPACDGQVCAASVRARFESEILDKSLEVSLASAAIVAAVGDGMHQQLGLMGRLATALGEAKINIVAIAQGSSERNVTFVVSEEDGVEALRALHHVL